ncbi:MAG TPA: gamma-glutamyltransferase [Actinomycetota bacterium]|jgi:gamma-glutamyltranspeptidase/glutathione hydrolase|nr:gamma-glutamyltransferase [Actinomycetota bacterium]
MPRPVRALLTVLLLILCLVAATVPAQAGRKPVKRPVATGTGGAIATVDLDASAAGLEVLRHGGNAVDAAVAAAATLGVTEAYSAGVGGGGFMVVHLAKERRVVTIDGRETAPAAFREDSFIDPATGQPIPFAERVTSGLGVGVPGTVATWQRALRKYGTRSLGKLLQPAIRVAERGFVVDQTFHDQTASNAARFAAFPATAELFLPGGAPPPVGSVLRNPDLARTYRLLARRGTHPFYRGRIAEAIAETVQDPPVDPASTLNVRPGLMTEADLAAYRALDRPPTRVGYRGYQVYGMGPPSSGGSTVGEALNILEGYDLGGESYTQALFHYLEATRLAFADRNRWVGDPDFVDVPLRGLLSQGFADERRCLIGDRANVSPVPPGDPFPPFGPGCPAGVAVAGPAERPATTHLTVADRWGNVVSYTLTIEQTGGSGIVVPGYGFLLNNELTDFNPAPLFPGVPDPNLPAPGKRPRSSMSPTIVVRDGRPVVAVGSPGGATIITTVLQILVEHLDRGRSLPEAIAAPRVSQRNSDPGDAEPAFLASPEAAALQALGELFRPAPTTPPLPSEIGAAAGIAFGRHGLQQAAAEPVRRGGGSALVVHPRP